MDEFGGKRQRKAEEKNRDTYRAHVGLSAEQASAALLRTLLDPETMKRVVDVACGASCRHSASLSRHGAKTAQ